VKRSALGVLFGAMTVLTMSMASCDKTAGTGRKGEPIPSAAAATGSAAPATPGPRVVFPDGTNIAVELAADDATRTQGLMYRDHLADDQGMIFLFPSTAEYTFWMKNTLIPLDMIWLDENRRIVHVAHDVPPCKADPCPSYPPNAQAKSVLEVAAGVAAKHHLSDGQTLRYEGFEHVVVQ
jgi:uncharacterized membrane protein (UPF0127 family)